MGDGEVTYVSLHREFHYPNTGYTSEDNFLNFPLRANCGDAMYLKVLNEALSKVNKEKIDVIAVSAGFDTHAGDLASLGLTRECCGAIGKRIAELMKPTFFVLEGGYSGENVGKDIDGWLKACGVD